LSQEEIHRTDYWGEGVDVDAQIKACFHPQAKIHFTLFDPF
jgi:hypothetical protein